VEYDDPRSVNRHGCAWWGYDDPRSVNRHGCAWWGTTTLISI
jgi:hypothetical protein